MFGEGEASQEEQKLDDNQDSEKVEKEKPKQEMQLPI